jgi:hypothetical protein
VHALHGIAGIVHGIQRFLVDVGRLDRVHLLLELDDLVLRLFEVFLVKLLPSQGGFGSYNKSVYNFPQSFLIFAR